MQPVVGEADPGEDDRRPAACAEREARPEAVVGRHQGVSEILRAVGYVVPPRCPFTPYGSVTRCTPLVVGRLLYWSTHEPPPVPPRLRLSRHLRRGGAAPSGGPVARSRALSGRR